MIQQPNGYFIATGKWPGIASIKRLSTTTENLPGITNTKMLSMRAENLPGMASTKKPFMKMGIQLGRTFSFR